MDEAVPIQIALGKEIRVMGVKEFARKVGDTAPVLVDDTVPPSCYLFSNNARKTVGYLSPGGHP